MQAVDTNVVLRFLLGDHPEQSPIAEKLFAGHVLLAASVLLETFWVLRSYYAFERERLAATLRLLVSWPNVTMIEGDAILWAVDQFAAGADFEDALHIVGASSAEAFATFDERAAHRLGPTSVIPVNLLR